MDLRSDRRRFLKLAGSGATLSLAGCTAPAPGEDLGNSNGGPESRATVTVALEIDQEKLASAREELVSQIQNGSLNQSEAQTQLFEIESELLTEAASTFEERVQSSDALSIEKQATEIGVLLVAGTPAALIQSISRPEVRGLFSAETYEQALAQQSQSP